MVLSGGNHDLKRVQEFNEELGLAGGKSPSTPGANDTVKNLAEAKDSLSEVDLKTFLRVAGKKLLLHLVRTHDSARDGHGYVRHVQANGAMPKLDVGDTPLH